jgi:LuxR family maltose regulon positive regulatory protein
MGSVIEILLLQALAHETQDDIPLALVSLERALTLAEPDGYVRIFVDEGRPVAELLGRMKAEGGRMKLFIRKLLLAFESNKDRSISNESGINAIISSLHPSSLIPHPLIEPLSERELEVLRLLGTELTGPEIARELLVSLSTVRTHTQNIYTKLGVNNRRAAVRRAEELDLL